MDYGEEFAPFRYALKDKSDVEPGYFKNYDAFYSHMMVVQRLGELEDKQEQGLLISLPCNVGDTVYRIWTCGKNGKSVAEFKIEHIDIDNYPQIEFSYRCTKGSHSFYQYRFCKLDDIGKTVFLTRSEAEEALARMKGE